jgi:hypothetical protein
MASQLIHILARAIRTLFLLIFTTAKEPEQRLQSPVVHISTQSMAKEPQLQEMAKIPAMLQANLPKVERLPYLEPVLQTATRTRLFIPTHMLKLLAQLGTLRVQAVMPH